MSVKTKICPNSIIKTAPEQLSSEIGEEAIILNLKSGVYYGLNEVGVTIWNSLSEPKKVSELLALLLEEYDVEAQRCESDLWAILEEMAANGLIEVVDEEAA